MSADQSRPPVRRPRQIGQADLPPGPARELRDAVYELYLRAGAPTLDDLEKRIADADDLPGAPSRDLISRIISGREMAASQQDAVTVAVALARDTGRDPAKVAYRVRDLWVAAKMTPSPLPSTSRRLGRPIGDCDPMDLEVHRAIEVPGYEQSLSALPTYVARAHDQRLREVTASAAGGVSRIGALVGGSSTGKTRACWEAIQQLPDQWWLWHPIDPSRHAAAAESLCEVHPYTVVWLNEAQHYLLTPGPTFGERVAAGLRTLLRDPSRAPVLILATIWPQYWATLTAPPRPGDSDPYAQARELLHASDIPVPDRFGDADMPSLRAAAEADPRLQCAIEDAHASRIIQHLAGAPELLRRYRNAPPVARAILQAAIDARRLGHPPSIPHTLLEKAAPGYLDDHDWHQVDEDWLEQALAYTAAPSFGVLGPLTRIRLCPGESVQLDEEPNYRLADYLEQTGRRERASVYPPAGFWEAAATTITDPQVLHRLGQEAHQRGRYQRATRLYRQAADRGDASALWNLALLREHAGDRAGAEELAIQAANGGHPEALRDLAWLLERLDDRARAEALAKNAANRGYAPALGTLARLREHAGDRASAEDLAIQAANRGHPEALQELARMREHADDLPAAEALYQQAADHGHPGALWELARMREHADDLPAAEALYQQAADHGHPGALGDLARVRMQAGDQAGANDLAIEAIARGHTEALWVLAQLRIQAGDRAGAEALYQQAASHGHSLALADLIRLREHAGDQVGAEHLAVQAADRGSTFALLSLAHVREQAGDLPAAEALYRDAAGRGNASAFGNLARLQEQAGDLLPAEALYRQAADCGDFFVLADLSRLREKAGDQAGAERIRRFGLNDDGSPAVSLGQ